MSLRIGIACHPTFGGSGIIATEIGQAMAAKGHQVHFVGDRPPARLDASQPRVQFHAVHALEYPVLAHPPYALALASALVDVARRDGLDLIHAHYAVPHATSAWMAAEILGDVAPKVVTTLHGTDITLVGADPSYLPITRHSILRSDAVTVPSAYLRDETWTRLELHPAEVPITVLPNFVDTDRFRPNGAERPHLTALFGDADVPTLVHCSNFRPLKQVGQIVEVLARLVRDTPVRLVLVGDGPCRPAVETQVSSLGLQDHVRFLGTVERLEELLRECTAFLLPSRTESFGLAALEALSSGVPVVASDVGGLPDVIRDGETGFLVPLDDVGGFADATRQLLDPDLHAQMAKNAREDAVNRFSMAPRVRAYEDVYLSL